MSLQVRKLHVNTGRQHESHSYIQKTEETSHEIAGHRVTDGRTAEAQTVDLSRIAPYQPFTTRGYRFTMCKNVQIPMLHSILQREGLQAFDTHWADVIWTCGNTGTTAISFDGVLAVQFVNEFPLALDHLDNKSSLYADVKKYWGNR